MKRSGLVFAVTLFAGLASADTITATGVDWNRGGSVWINEDGTDVYAYFAGVINIAVTSQGKTFNRDSLCVDLFTDIFLGVTYGTTLLRPSNVPSKNLERISWLVDNALLPTQGPVYDSLLDPSYWVTTAAQGEGIQLAIWDITHDSGDGFYSGRVQAGIAAGQQTDPQALLWAQTYEAVSLNHTSNLAFVYDNVDLGSGAPAQMLEGPMFQDGGPTTVPEPVTSVLTGGVLVAIGVFRRRRARN